MAQVLFACHLLTIWGLALSNGFLGLTVLWCAYHWRSFNLDLISPKGSRRPFLLFFFGSWLAFVISAATSFWPLYSFGELSSELNLLTLPLALLLFTTTALVVRLLRWLAAMMIGIALIALVQYLLQWQSSPGAGGLHDRIVGPFSHYMTLAGVLLIGTCIVVGLLSAQQGRERYLLWGALGLVLAVQVLTLTRGVWIGLLVILVMASQDLFGRRRLAILVVSAVALLLVLLSLPLFRERVLSIFSLTYPSNYDRLAMAYAGLSMLKDSPFYGIGPGLVEFFYPIYRHPTAPSHQLAHLHNNLFQIAAERGLVSLVTFIGLMVSAFLMAKSRLKTAAGNDRAIFVVGSLAIVGFNVAGLFEANWRDTEVQRLMLFLLAACYVSVGEERTFQGS